MHEKKARLYQKTRPCDAIVIPRDSEKQFSGTSTHRRKHYADGKNYKVHYKQMWIPVKRAESKNVKSSDGLNTVPGLKLSEQQSVEGVVNGTKTSSVVHRKVARIGEKSSIQTYGNGVRQYQHGADLVRKEAKLDISVELSVQNKNKNHNSYTAVGRRDGPKHGYTNNSAAQETSLHADLGRNMHAHLEKAPLRTRVSRPADLYDDLCSRDISKFEAGGPSNQRMIFSPDYREFRPKAVLQQYMPRNSVVRKIMSVAPGTKPGPRWCPTGLTHTQKRRVQRLRASEIKEEIAKKKRGEWFSRDKSMVSTKIWTQKRIAVEENKNSNDIVVDKSLEIKSDEPAAAYETMADMDFNTVAQMTSEERILEEINKDTDEITSNECSEYNEDTSCDMEASFIFALPAEFRAPEAEGVY
jgi:hypothetical protein